MANTRLKLILARFISSRLTLVVVALAAAILAAIVFPATREGGIAADPAVEAEESYVSLLAQLGAQETELMDPIPNSPDSARAEEAAPPVTRLPRNIFAPASRGIAPLQYGATTSVAQVSPRVPRLTGVFIDGYSKQAVIDGSMVEEGDIVSGCLVIEISPTWVTIERSGTIRKLVLGGNP